MKISLKDTVLKFKTVDQNSVYTLFLFTEHGQLTFWNINIHSDREFLKYPKTQTIIMFWTVSWHMSCIAGGEGNVKKQRDKGVKGHKCQLKWSGQTRVKV